MSRVLNTTLWILGGLAAVWVLLAALMMSRMGGMMAGCPMPGMMAGGRMMGGMMWMMLMAALTWLVMLGLVGVLIYLIMAAIRSRRAPA